MPKITVLTTLYGSERYVRPLYERTKDVLGRLTDSYEFVFVDDGSPDHSKAEVLKLIEQDKNVRLIELSRNFGHHKAVMAGLEYVTGDLVFLFDSDLEEDPELLERFYRLMEQDPELDVVYAYMEQRKGALLERLPGSLFYWLINRMADIEVPKNMMAARLMRRQYVDSLVRFRESHVFLGGIMTLAGFKQLGVPATKGSKGSTTYTWRRKFTQALDALVSFTNKPLTFVAAVGIAISFVSFLVALYLAARLVFYGDNIEGWAVVLASLWFLGGLIISSIGLVGFYVGRVFLQVKMRPNAIIKKIHNPAAPTAGEGGTAP